MGLDMFAYTTEFEIPAVDFGHPEDADDFIYWRQHRFLHFYMYDLYRLKGGKRKDFNYVPVRIDAADIDDIEWVFGENGWFRPEDKDFIRQAREAIANGKFVYYAASV